MRASANSRSTDTNLRHCSGEIRLGFKPDTTTSHGRARGVRRQESSQPRTRGVMWL